MHVCLLWLCNSLWFMLYTMDGYSCIFPILIMAYDRMLETGKKMLYICMIALCFIINYYLSAMSLIYIFLICGIRMVVMQEKAVEGNCMECRYRHNCRYRTFSIRACSCICTAFFITERWCV